MNNRGAVAQKKCEKCGGVIGYMSPHEHPIGVDVIENGKIVHYSWPIIRCKCPPTAKLSHQKEKLSE